MASVSLETNRLRIRDWSVEDTEAAFAIYGNPDVAAWLAPVMRRVTDVQAMRSVLEAWTEAQPNLTPPTGRWAIVRRSDNLVIGGLGLRLLPPYEEDIEIRWQVRPDEWGRGYATEAAKGLLGWAFTQDLDEVFAVARSSNARALATARNLGMEWVGETSKYYGLLLQVFRLRRADFIT